MSDAASNNPTTTAANSPAPGTAPNDTSPTTKPEKQYLDFDGERVDVDELKRERKHYNEAGKRFREAAEMRKSVEGFVERFQRDPESVLDDPRVPAELKKKLAQKWLSDSIQPQYDDPRDAELAQLKKQLQERDDREKTREQQAAEQERHQLIMKRQDEIAATLTAALESTPFYADPELRAGTIREMAMYMRVCRQAKYDPSPADLAAHVQQNALTRFRQALHGLEGDRLKQVLGEDVFKRVQAAVVGEIRAKRAAPPPTTAENWEPSQAAQQDTRKKHVDPYAVRGGR